MGLSFEEQKKIEQLKARCQLYSDSNNGTIALARSFLRGVFILNGTSAIAIVYSRNISLLEYAYPFAIGAFLSVLATGVSFILSYCIGESWKKNVGINPISICIHKRTHIILYIIIIILSIASICVFVYGSLDIYYHLT